MSPQSGIPIAFRRERCQPDAETLSAPHRLGAIFDMSHLDTLLSKLWNRKPKPHVEAAERMFDVVNEAARRPIFFTDLGVADTVDGRFDLLMLHVFLAMDRLSEVEEAADVSQAFMDWTFRILDESLREAGVGDTSVPKKMHAMADAFYGRSEAYKAGLEADSDGPLREAIERNLYRHAEM
ncbi:MAG: ubiquinol-cytochrome C chaperone family protein [Pseudomonadota bacterium]